MEKLIHLTPADEKAAEAIEAELQRELKDGGAIRRLLARLIAKVESAPRAAGLDGVVFDPREDDEELVFVLPGSSARYRMVKSLARTEHRCSLRGCEIRRGEIAYHAGWKSSAWIRSLRICYECAQRVAPLE